MARLFKVFLVLSAGIVGILAIAVVALVLFFDPNDFRDRISAAVTASTGRALTIEGDLSVSYFPWLAVDVGRVEVGNAEGFGSDPFLTFERAKLSVRVLPLIFRQEVAVGTAALDGLVVNLEVARNGVTNWDDLASAGEESDGDAEEGGGPSALDVANLRVSNATVSYRDRGSDERYRLADLSFETGRIVAGSPIGLDAEFDFDTSPGELGGHIVLRGTALLSESLEQLSLSGVNVSGTLNGLVEEATAINFDSRAIAIDTAARTADLGELDLSVLGLQMSADVEPFSYAAEIRPTASVSVAEFSLIDLMQTLAIEPPETADPNALQRVALSAKATVGERHIALSELNLDLDDSTMTGKLSVPIAEGEKLEFDLAMNAIALDAYMAPAEESSGAGGGDGDDVEIPVDLIRALEANGRFGVERVSLAGLEFQFVEVGVTSSGGKLRLHPLASQLYEGSYNGDIRIDASGRRPSLSVNERIEGVNLRPLAKAMFDRDNVSGSIAGSFALSGSGATLSAIRQDLDGTMRFELNDGAWEGIDVWHQLRAARALLRQQPAPAPRTPARTEFTSVKATGTVTDGMFSNDDFRADLPFLQLTGAGLVDLVRAEINYGLRVRVLEKPELMANVSEAELADFTETVIPLKITGPLASPSVKPDIEAILRQEVDTAIEKKKDEIKGRLLNRILGGDERDAAQPDAAPGEAPPAEPQEEEDLEEQLKKKLLKDLIGR